MRNSCWALARSAPHWFYALAAAFTQVPTPTTPDDCVNIADVAAVATRDGGRRCAQDAAVFGRWREPLDLRIHRVVAEYLGAKWLAACFNSGRSERRIFSLFRPGDGVPTSLRGLHAWLAHFGPGSRNSMYRRRPLRGLALRRRGDHQFGPGTVPSLPP